jgi:DNA-binding NarL/FixJ family response regulator
MRVVIADDSVLLREGIARVLAEGGMEVVAQAGDADDLLRKVNAHRPDVAVVDIRMPPRSEDDGVEAALTIRQRQPETGVVLLSQYVTEAYAMRLLEAGSEGVGYLLKDRVADVEGFVDGVRRVGEGGSVLDPQVVQELMGRRRKADDPLDQLTPRERDVLALMAEGLTNGGIAGEALRHREGRRAPRDEHLLQAAHRRRQPGPQAGPGRPAVAAALTAPAVVGRDGELRTLRPGAPRGGAGPRRARRVTGTSGVGKTALLGAATAEAEANGVRVARADAVELERGLALGLVRRLLGPVARAEGLLEHAPAAARALLGPDGDDAATSEHDPLTAAVALVWVAAVLAERGPLLLVVDDAQWADDASVRVLAQVRERLGRLGAVLVLAQRPEGGSPDLRALIEDPRSVRLDLRPLGPPAITELVRGRAPQASDAQVAAVVAASGGTAFYVAALADELAAGATDLGEDAPELVAGSVVRRLRAAGPDGTAVARAVAVLENDAELRHVAALSGLEPGRAAAAADALVRDGVLVEGRPLAFPHAIVAGGRARRPAGRRSLPGAPPRRRGAPPGGAPPHRVAMHLAAVEPAGDQALVDELVGPPRRAPAPAAARPR